MPFKYRQRQRHQFLVEEQMENLWWPQQSHYDSVDFFNQPNELVQCTINRDQKTLNHSAIMHRCQVNFQFHQICRIAPAPEHIQSAAFYLAYPFCLGGWSQSLEHTCVDQRQRVVLTLAFTGITATGKLLLHAIRSVFNDRHAGNSCISI